MPESRALPSNRSETPSESLEESLLLVLQAFTGLASNTSTNLEADMWQEAYCRDVEAFSHLLHLEENERPQKCPQINTSLCAVLYDRFDHSESESLGMGRRKEIL